MNQTIDHRDCRRDCRTTSDTLKGQTVGLSETVYKSNPSDRQSHPKSRETAEETIGTRETVAGRCALADNHPSKLATVRVSGAGQAVELREIHTHAAYPRTRGPSWPGRQPYEIMARRFGVGPCPRDSRRERLVTGARGSTVTLELPWRTLIGGRRSLLLGFRCSVRLRPPAVTAGEP